MNANRKKIKIFSALIMAAALAAAAICGCGKKQEENESIVFGDIDFDAEVVQQAHPKTQETQETTVGNTYLNLLNNGHFCESDTAYYFVVLYDSQKYLIRQNKVDSKNTKIYQGDIRNLFCIDGWVYGIVNEGLNEYMVVMDEFGNNQRVSARYVNNIRTMLSDGNKVYFTVDQRNVLGMAVATAICKCDMDLSNMEIDKTVTNVMSQVDLIAINNGLIYFNETLGGSSIERYTHIDIGASEYPIFYKDHVFVFDKTVCSAIVGENVEINSVNMHRGIIYASVSSAKSNFLISYDIESGESTFEKVEAKIDSIYEYSSGIVLFSEGKYERMQK